MYLSMEINFYIPKRGKGKSRENRYISATCVEKIREKLDKLLIYMGKVFLLINQ